MNNNDLPNREEHVQKKLKLKKKGLLIILFTIMMLLVVGTSFALWQITIQQTDSNKIQSSCLQLTLTNESSGIELINAAPISDDEGKKLTPYRFTITNTCNNKATYAINLENVTIEGEKLLSEQYIKAQLGHKNTTTEETQTESYEEVFLDKLEDKYLNETTVIEKARRSYKLYNSIIEANATESFELRLWMDIDTPTIDAVMDATFQSKISIVAENILDQPSPSPSSNVPVAWQDNGIFKDYYEQAYDKLETLTTSEKIGQLLVASYTTQSRAISAIENYNVTGVLFFESAFTGKSLVEVQNMTSELKSKAKIPLMLPVDEEGGRVVRISPNLNLVSEEVATYPNLFFTNSNNKNAWRLAGDLYNESNNFDSIKEQERVRNGVLKKLGLNFNFAPVVDIANPPAYISDRAFGQSAELTGEYAKAVIQAGKGSGVGHSLKHFPGYGNNSDTHGSTSVDETSLEELRNTHLVPFIEGINAGAEAVMIAHNITAAIDKDLPSSLSKGVHDLLFDDLGFTGLAITDDLSMSAIGDKYSKQYLKAFQAGNHILLTSDSFQTAHSELSTALDDGTITMEELDKRVFKVLAWKYYNGLLQ